MTKTFDRLVGSFCSELSREQHCADLQVIHDFHFTMEFYRFLANLSILGDKPTFILSSLIPAQLPASVTRCWLVQPGLPRLPRLLGASHCEQSLDQGDPRPQTNTSILLVLSFIRRSVEVDERHSGKFKVHLVTLE